jgi:glutathione S-transferase
MSEEIILYTNPMSRGRVARWMLEEVGCPYRAEILQYGTTMKAPEYLGINPMGKVPALKHGDMIITETAAICAYLADAFPEKQLAPALGDKARGAYFRWLFFAAGPAESVIVNKGAGFVVPHDKLGMVGYGTYDSVMNLLERELSSRECIAGDSFSAADVFLVMLLNWGMMFGTVEKRPEFERYVERHFARPAALSAKEKDDALMPKEH